MQMRQSRTGSVEEGSKELSNILKESFKQRPEGLSLRREQHVSGKRRDGEQVKKYIRWARGVERALIEAQQVGVENGKRSRGERRTKSRHFVCQTPLRTRMIWNKELPGPAATWLPTSEVHVVQHVSLSGIQTTLINLHQSTYNSGPVCKHVEEKTSGDVLRKELGELCVLQSQGSVEKRHSWPDGHCTSQGKEPEERPLINSSRE